MSRGAAMRILLLLLFLALPLLAEEPEYMPIGDEQLVDGRLVIEIGSFAAPKDVRWRVEVSGETIHYEGAVRDASLADKEVYYDLYVTSAMEGYTAEEAASLFQNMLNEGARIGKVEVSDRPFKGSHRTTFEFGKSGGWMTLGSTSEYALLLTGQGMTRSQFDSFLASYRPTKFRKFEHVKKDRKPLPVTNGRLEVEGGSIAVPRDTTWYLGESEDVKTYVGLRSNGDGMDRFSVTAVEMSLNTEPGCQEYLDGYAESSGFEATNRQITKRENGYRLDFEAASAGSSVPGSVVLRKEAGKTFCFSALGADAKADLDPLVASFRPDPKLKEQQRDQFKVFSLVFSVACFFFNACLAAVTLVISLLHKKRVVTTVGLVLMVVLICLESGSAALIAVARTTEPGEVGYALGYLGSQLAVAVILPLLALLLRHKYLPD